MPRLLEDKILVVGSMKTQPLPPGGLLSVTKYEEAKLQLLAKCKGASLMETESFMSLNVKNGSDVDARAGGQIPHAFSPVFGKLKMLTSEACHKNYVIFDQCEGKSTVIFHPSRLKSPTGSSMGEPCFAGEATYCGGSLQTYDRRWIEGKLDFCSSSAALSTAGVQAAPLCKDATGMQSQPKMASSNEARCSLIDIVHTQKAEKDIMRSVVLSEIEEESCEEFHENTEEIDALLSSDDELSSTGHSPSSDASSCGLCAAKDGHDNKDSGKKRKLGHRTLDDVDDDADSGHSKPIPDLPSRDNKRASSCIVVSRSKHTDTFPGVEASEVSNRGEKSSLADDVFAEKSECKSVECSGTLRGGPADSSKRMKIQSNVQQLKSVVPGGDYLDTAGVLGQTIQYVKCLQRRLRDLEAARYFQGSKNNELGL